MADTINIDDITSDEDIDAILNQIDSGTYESKSDTSEDSSTDVSENDDSASDEKDSENDDENGVDENEDDSNEDDTSSSDEDENDEDTNQSDGSDENEENQNENDGSSDDSKEDSENDDEDNAREEQDADKSKDNESNTDEKSDGDSQDKATIDVKDFERYKKFYDEVANAEFMANGKKVKGLTDPAKIIQAQQMSYGFSDKMAGFKKYKPFLIPLKEKGILDDPDKFNLALSLLDGDKEALKSHIKSLELDPVVDLDTEEINYTKKNHLATKEVIAIDEAFEQARNFGIEDKVRNVIGSSEWDDESFSEFVNNPSTRNDLIDHINSGAYDLVKDKIQEIKRTDVHGSFSSMKMTDQYRTAVKELQAEAAANEAEEAKIAEANSSTAKIEAEKARIEQERKQNEYKLKAEEEKRKIAEDRKKASSVSKTKPKAKPKAKFDPMTLEDDDLDALVDSMISGNFNK